LVYYEFQFSVPNGNSWKHLFTKLTETQIHALLLVLASMFDAMKNIVGNTPDNLIGVSKPCQLRKEQWHI
jgi:hypothetical protein